MKENNNKSSAAIATETIMEINTHVKQRKIDLSLFRFGF